MKRQFKAAALVSTAALLAIGASFTSMAAAKAKTGTWVLEADGWYCYDKDGNAYTNEWCLSYGKEYFVDENGLLATHSWVEDEDKFYFVGSTGAKTVNDWRYITAPYDEDGEEAWFYFDAKGEMEKGKKVINGKTYYFDVDGRMLTGWVSYDGTDAAAADSYADAGLTYCDETGARVQSAWVEDWAPELDEDEEEDYDKNWHYLSSTGGLTKGKKNDISGKTYLFDTDGKMLYGWVVAKDTDNDNKHDVYSNVGSISGTAAADAVYFCGTAEQGYVKKDRWVKTWMPEEFEDQDEDDTKYWYYVGKDGKVFVPQETDEKKVDLTKLTFIDGDLNKFVEATGSNATYFGLEKEIHSKNYMFDGEGRMVTGFVDVASDSNALRMYFGGSNDGTMKTGNVTIADESGVSFKFYFGDRTKNGYTKGVAVTGAANGYLYDNGQLVTQDKAKYHLEEVGGKQYLINNNGAIQTSRKVYKDGSETLYDYSKVGVKYFHDGKIYAADGKTVVETDAKLKGSIR